MNRLLASLSLAAIPLTALPSTLFSQSLSGTDGYYSDAYSSGGYAVYNPDGSVFVPGVTQADDFALTSAATVQSITFDGGSDGTTSTGLTNFSGFEIQVLSLSGSVLYDATVATSALSAVDTRTSNDGFGEVYALTYTLPTGLSLAAGSYLLNVGAVETDATLDRFVWSTGTATNASHFQNLFDGNGYQGVTSDLAFTVSGVQAVPEPTSVAALVLGVLAVLRRRKVTS